MANSNDKNIDLLTYLLNVYQKFLFYDAVISIIERRNFSHIYQLFKLINNAFICIVNHTIIDDKYIETYKKNAYEVIDDYLLKYNNGNDTESDIKKKISDKLSDKAIEEQSVRYVLSQEKIVENFLNFTISYNNLHKYTNGLLSDLLTEFHNAMSHLIVAMSCLQEKENNDEYASQYDDRISRNTDKAVSHLKRGMKDSYKIMIRCMYPMIKRNKELLHSFRAEFINIRCDEILNLSDMNRHNETENSIKTIALSFMDKLKIHKNSETGNEFCEYIRDFYLYSE